MEHINSFIPILFIFIAMISVYGHGPMPLYFCANSQNHAEDHFWIGQFESLGPLIGNDQQKMEQFACQLSNYQQLLQQVHMGNLESGNTEK